MSSLRWANPQKQRNFFDSISSKLNINKPSDWGNVTIDSVIKLGGASLLDTTGGSLKKALLCAYPGKLIFHLKETGVNWELNWFRNGNHMKRGYWEEKENQKQFLLAIAKKLNLTKPSDWGRVKNTDIKELGGGTLINRNSGSLFRMLQNVFPGS